MGENSPNLVTLVACHGSVVKWHRLYLQRLELVGRKSEVG
jgi:hypothetical protein